MSPAEKMRVMRLMSEFDVRLMSILKEEIDHNNQISKVQTGWPEPCDICICLTNPFHRRYESPDVRLEMLDVHYGKEGYFSLKSNDSLIQ